MQDLMVRLGKLQEPGVEPLEMLQDGLGIGEGLLVDQDVSLGAGLGVPSLHVLPDHQQRHQ